MSIPQLTVSSVERALKSLVPELGKIASGPYESTKYDVLWEGYRFPPKVVVSRAVEIEHGVGFPASDFSGGTHTGQANAVLEQLGFSVVPKLAASVRLPLQLHTRYGRKQAFIAVGVKYTSQKQHLNVGLSPRCTDGGYLIFVTLNKEELDPTHDYPDEIFADQLIWVSRRGVTADHRDYVNLRVPETRVSLFVRTRRGEDFIYAGELDYVEHRQFTDMSSGKAQLRFIWRLHDRLPDSLLQELTFGIRKGKRSPPPSAKSHSRAPSSFDELRKAYSYVLGTAERTVVPEHQNYQVRLNQFLKDKGVEATLEKNFIDIAFSLDGESFIGEIKVTRNLTIPQAFRAALGQLLEYAYLLFPAPPNMIMFLDQKIDSNRIQLASLLKIAVVVERGEDFVILNPECCPATLNNVFSVRKELAVTV